MIRKPQNWESVQAMTDRQKLPVGAYVCKVKKAIVQSNDYGDQLALLFDIDSGEYKDYYNDDYLAQNIQNRRWKGVMRVWLAKDDGSERDEWTKSTFKGLVTSFEESNPGTNFDWKEMWFVGKRVGILYRNEEWEYEGKTGWAARPFRAISTGSVESGKYTIPKDKPLKNKIAQQNATMNGFEAGFTQVDNDDDLPF